MQVASARVRRIVGAGGDALLLVGVVFCLPFVIMTIGIPIALIVQLVLWIGRFL
jgi:hypothetical protein